MTHDNLRAAATRCADALEAALRDRWQPESHPDSMRRFLRDMVEVDELRAALSAPEPAPAAPSDAKLRDVIDWLLSGDTGMSSKAIVTHMLGSVGDRALMLGGIGTREPGCDPPWDADDRGRCIRLLQRFPEWQSRLDELAELSEEWAEQVPLIRRELLAAPPSEPRPAATEAEPSPDLTDAEQSVWDWCNNTLGLSHENGEELARRLVGLRTDIGLRPLAEQTGDILRRAAKPASSFVPLEAMEPERADALPEDVEQWCKSAESPAWVGTTARSVANYLRSLPQRFAALEKERDDRAEQVDELLQTIDEITVACGSLGLMRSELADFVRGLRKERDEARAEAKYYDDCARNGWRQRHEQAERAEVAERAVERLTLERDNAVAGQQCREFTGGYWQEKCEAAEAYCKALQRQLDAAKSEAVQAVIDRDEACAEAEGAEMGVDHRIAQIEERVAAVESQRGSDPRAVLQLIRRLLETV